MTQRRRRRFPLCVHLALLASLGACSAHKSGPNGTATMADSLARVYERAMANPGANEFLNQQRAEVLKAGISQQAQATAQAEFLLAQEQLLAGETREAIEGLEKLRGRLRLTIDSTRPDNKPFFDMLGVAYLRLGEQENCNANPTVSVCILGELHHTQQEGARKAIAIYTDLLRAFPDDRGSQWLLNIAYMAIGGYPSQVPPQWRVPGLALQQSASMPLFYNVANSTGTELNSRAGGLCIADFNNDGLLDLFTTSWGFRDPVHLMLADGSGRYADRQKEAGLTGIVGGINCVHADFDNDGNEDIYILRGGWLGDPGAAPNSLLRNQGDGTFEDVTFAAGVVTGTHPSHSAAWADFNLDGWLDLFVGHEGGTAMSHTPHPSQLFLNDRDGTFTDVTAKVGIALDEFVKGAVWGDVNNDGLPDLYVSIFGAPNRLYMNRGGSDAGWRFEEAAAQAGVREPVMSFPAWFFDVDNDGWEDLLALGYDNRVPLQEAVAREHLGLPMTLADNAGATRRIDHSHLYRNTRDSAGGFADVTRAAGLEDKAVYAMGSNFGDIDNDGWLDFYVGTGNPDLRSIIPNRMFRGVDGTRFEEITMQGGFGHLQKGHGTAFADLDRDGDEDVYMVVGGAYYGDVSAAVLFENPGWPKRNWITLDLEGRTANRSAIGARVEIVVADERGRTRSIHRTVNTGGSFGAGPLQLHVGIGAAARVPLVRVIWPDSARSVGEYANLTVRREYRLVQGQPAELLDRPPVPFDHAVIAQKHTMPGMVGPQ